MADETNFGEKVMIGLLAMLCADRDDRLAAGAQGRKPELVLAEVGFSAAEIARVTGRNVNTVKTIVRRGRTSSTKKSTSDPEGKRANG